MEGKSVGIRTDLKRKLFPKMLPFLINKEFKKLNKPLEIMETFLHNYKKELLKKK